MEGLYSKTLTILAETQRITYDKGSSLSSHECFGVAAHRDTELTEISPFIT